MSFGSAATRLVVLLAVLGAITAPGLAATGDGQTLRQMSPDETRTETSLLVEIQSNGDAQWTVSTTFNLTSENETAAYRELAEAFESGGTEALGLTAFQQASDLASTSTGRQMEIANVARSSAPEQLVENGTGRLTLTFTWTNFARVESDTLTIGDVFRTAEGQWLPGLEPDQTLTIQPPTGFGVVNSSVPPAEGTLRWDGPQDFDEDALDATFTGSGPGDPNGTETPPGGDGDESGGLLWVSIFLLGIGVLAAVGYFVMQRDGIDLPSSGGEADVDGSTAPEQRPAPDADEGTAEPAESGGDDEIDVELLSDEERVERLLERNGGRMKQADIVKETGWSNAKVSQLLSSMQDEERIDKLRIGRENLISFPDEDITDLEE